MLFPSHNEASVALRIIVADLGGAREARTLNLICLVFIQFSPKVMPNSRLLLTPDLPLDHSMKVVRHTASKLNFKQGKMEQKSILSLNLITKCFSKSKRGLYLRPLKVAVEIQIFTTKME